MKDGNYLMEMETPFAR